jgi:glycerol-3-phosphate acyltransferase PlsY
VVLLTALRYVAIASICGAATLALVGLARFGVTPAPVGALVAAILIAFAHRGNLERFVAGAEGRIGSR